jgi:hypothetical protein
MAIPKKHYAFKSAVDGKFVTEKFADNHPKTTFKERIDPPKKPKGK